ncbi:MAG: fumarate hydratase [Oscillospiraceae bacterium]|nr:fumarate hydratase [Oscillospiraceae bacterium]
MRIVEAIDITQAVAELCIKANTCVGEDIYNALDRSRQDEALPNAKWALDTILENAVIAKRENLPICQDTGMAVVFVGIGSDIHVNGDINQAINQGVRQGYRDGYFRNSVVQDPIDRINTNDNTPAVIHYDFVPGDRLSITVAPKGFGSENMSGVSMLKPSDGAEGIKEFVVKTIESAGASPCPPIIAGVGIGGTMEKAAILAKQALLRDVGSVNADPYWAEFESELLAHINALSIGPAGFGGKTTALALHILTYPTHIAGLPVAVNIGCHANRHQTVEL